MFCKAATSVVMLSCSGSSTPVLHVSCSFIGCSFLQAVSYVRCLQAVSYVRCQHSKLYQPSCTSQVAQANSKSSQHLARKQQKHPAG